MQIKMDIRTLSVLLTVLIPFVVAHFSQAISQEERRSGYRRGLHYHTKRHMMPTGEQQKPKRRQSTLKPREMRKKPSGHLKPLDEDDMENDEVVSVAVGPPPLRPKYDKVNWRHTPKQTNRTTTNVTATNLVKDILTQLGREFLTHQVSEDFVFGQYIGNAMKNLTSDIRLRMQHEILDLVVKYQKISSGELRLEERSSERALPILKDMKTEKRSATNETEDNNWPDFSNLEKIVG